MTKVHIVIPVYGGIVQCADITASCSEKKAQERLADWDKTLGIVRDHEGRHEHPEHDCHLVEVNILESPSGYNPDAQIGNRPGGLKPFRAQFVQHDGEFEYDSELVVWARTLEAAENKCRRFMRQWWGNGARPYRDLDGNIDANRFEEKDGYRIVELGAVTEMKTINDLISHIGEI